LPFSWFDGQIKQCDVGKVNSVVLGLSPGVRRTEIPLLPPDFPEGTSLIWRSSQGEFLRAFPFGLLKYNTDASEPLWLAKDQPNRLDARLSRTPAFFISLQSCRFNRNQEAESVAAR
jgi:hypothetical protein